MFKKFIIHSFAITGFAMVARDLTTIIAVKRSSKSDTAKGWLIGTLAVKYAEADFIEAKLTEEEIGYADDMHRISKELK